MIKFYLTLIVIVSIGIYTCSNAQPYKYLNTTDSAANKDYNLALTEYLELYKNKKDDPDINFNIGSCYLHINGDKSKAVPYLEFVYHKGGYKDDLLLYLGMAYMYSYKFDKALSFFIDYRSIITSKKAELIENYYEDLKSGKLDYQKKITSGNFGLVEHYIENCEDAKELYKRPLNVTFENLGKEINSKYPDYFPFITQNQGTLYFTSRREENPLKLKNPQGYFTSDIYVSKVKDGQWTTAKNMGPLVNSVADEQCVYIMPNGKKMIVFADNENVTGDIFIIPLQELLQKTPTKFIQPIQTEYREFEGCLTESENMLIISTNRPGGSGETDLYMFNKLTTGEWGFPINLGPRINTKYKEAFPIYDEKNCILYFASEGHTNMGGFDIFKSKFDSETQKFGPAQNIGYPINTPEDDMVFNLAENNRDGYISAVMDGGFGDLDLYKVVFNDVENQTSIIRGVIVKNDWHDKDIDAFVSLRDVKTNVEIDAKNVNPQSGRYVFAVEPGTYILTASSPNYQDLEQEITVFDKSDFVFEIEKNFLLQEIDTTTSKRVSTKERLPKSKNYIIRGIISTNDTLQKKIDAAVSILDAKTRKKLEEKKANTQSGRYFFVVKPGKYIFKASSPGYKNFEQEINIADNPGYIFETEKNILLKKIPSPSPPSIK